ncbi:MAG: glyoxalase [Candidatus Rokuibacteriota bacterium]|nr:MAG: glyoxalase [Candidatus Rokubacteria bacterium]
MNKVKPVPQGYRTATPYLIIDGAAKALDFYKRIFGAVEKMRMPSPGGKVGHAEITIGDSIIMLADEHPEIGARSPRAFGGSGVGIMLYVDDVDVTVKNAVAEGAKLVQKVEDKFYGDRTGTIEDPWGHTWHVGTHKEDVSEDEMKRRMASMAKAG